MDSASFCSISIENTERGIKFNKKLLRGYLCWNIFNVFILLFDFHDLMASQSLLSAFSFGCMVITCMWSLGFAMSHWREIRDDKRKLRFLQELHETQLASGERQQYLDAKQHYESMNELYKDNK